MIARADAFPLDEWTASESTARLDYASADVPRVHVAEPDDLPPAPHHLVGIDRQPWRFPWFFLLSFVTTMAALVVAHGL